MKSQATEVTASDLMMSRAPLEDLRDEDLGSKFRNLPYLCKVVLPYKGKVDEPNLPYLCRADGPQKLPYICRDLSRSSYQGGCINSDVSEPGACGLPRWVAPPVPQS